MLWPNMTERPCAGLTLQSGLRIGQHVEDQVLGHMSEDRIGLLYLL